MEISSPLLVEISSDEETGFGDTNKGGLGGVAGGFDYGDDYNWLSELLGEVDRDKYKDSDDLVLVGEAFPKPPQESQLQPSKLPANGVGNDGGGGAGDDDDDDDDCVVLDGDPDKPVLVGNGRAVADDDNSDDLEIVGEKGEVACRDFPHSRHLCAKFLFTSTAHEVHCSQCHCYVCDSLAPCAHWGTGKSTIDHCHASDKEEFWRAERKNRKKGCKPVPAIPIISDTSFLGGLRQTTQVSALAQPQLNSMLPNQMSVPVTMHPSSVSPNKGVPNVISPGRSHLYRCNVPIYKHKSQLVSPQLLNACNSTVTSRYQSYKPENRSSQLFPPRAGFNKSVFARGSPNNRRGYGKRYIGSQFFKEPTEKRSHVSEIPVLNRNHASNQRNASRMANSLFTPVKFCATSSMDVRCAGIPSQPQRHSQPVSSCLSSDPVIKHQLPSESYTSSNFVNVPPLQPQGASQSNVGNFKNMIISQPDLGYRTNCSVSSPILLSDQSDAGNDLGNQLHSVSIMPSPPNMGKTFENQSSQHQGYSDPSSLCRDGQYDVQLRSQTQIALVTTLEDFDFDFDFDPSFSYGNLQEPLGMYQLQSAEVIDNTQNQSKAENGENQSIAPVDNFHHQSFASSDSDAYCNLPTNPDTLDFHFDSRMFDNQPLQGSFEVPLSPPWNVISSEPVSGDADTLFDI